MPSIKLYGRRWHFSTDIMAIPAFLAALFHTAWIIILPAWAGAKNAWPRHCPSGEGVQYVALFGGMLGAFAANLVVDVLLVYHSLQGAPFEVSKRRWVPPLLYASTAPLVCQLTLAVYGTYVATQLEPNCWPVDNRNAVTNLAQGLVFSTWAVIFVAAVGIAVTYNMYPQHHDLSSWEARCECIASTLCCHANVTRRPDRKRPPLSNIAELTAGLLSHVDLDATDITAGLFLAAAAQNRRRRLRVAKALLPVYKALRSSSASSPGSSTADERSTTDDDDDDDDDARSIASSVNDVPRDRKLDRMIARQQSQRRQLQPQGRAEPAGPPAVPGDAAALLDANRQRRQERHIKGVSWAEDVFEPGRARSATTVADGGIDSDGKVTTDDGHVPPDLSGISLPEPAQRQLQQEQQESVAHTPDSQDATAAVSDPAGVPGGGTEPATSLPLTEDNLAILDQHVALVKQGFAPETEEVQAAAEVVAEELMADLPAEQPDQQVDIVDQLANAIEEEIEQLGGSQQVPADAVLEVSKEDSLDLSALEVDPEAPSIWFSTASSRAAAGHGLSSSRGSGLTDAAVEGGAREAAGQPASDEELSSESPFYSVGGGSSQVSSVATAAARAAEPSDAALHSVAVEAAAAIAVSGSSSGLGKGSSNAFSEGPITQAQQPRAPEPASGVAVGLPPATVEAVPPPADEVAAAAVAQVAAQATAANSRPLSSQQTASAAGDNETVRSSRIDLQQQLTMRYPVVITPSEHVDDFRGVLSAATLADIYAGRHNKVPASILKEAVHFLKFSYAVYSLQPKIEAPSSGLDVACCAYYSKPTDPQKVIFKGMTELEQLEDDGSVELLHINCSNRVLAHLPYMICLDHAKRTVVLAIRGTISAADIVTDAIVYPEPLDTWLPQQIKQGLSEPAFAHAGMMAAAKAIFQDMTEREILQQLVSDEEVADFTAPQAQHAQRSRASASSRASQYDADAGSSAAGAAVYKLNRSRASSGGTSSSVAANHQHHQRGGTAAPDSASPASNGFNHELGPGLQHAQQERQRQEQKQGREQHQALQAERIGQDGLRHHSMQRRIGDGGNSQGQQDGNRLSPGRQVGEIMRQKIEDEGWQFIVEGHSLGAGAAALISLKLLETYRGLKCIAYSCPGGLVSKNLAHAMAPFTTTVAVGKDAVPRSTVGNLARLMDEIVTALARCKQPKLKVLLLPWWRRRRAAFSDLFYSYDNMPAEPREVLQQYYESRARIGQPLSMYPPGRVLFLRPIKTRQSKEWDAVWIEPEDLIAEGLLISPHMLRDHLCSQAYESLTAAAARAEQVESSNTQEAGRRQASRRVTASRAVRPKVLPRRANRERWRQRLHTQRTGSLQQVLIEAS